MQEIDNRLLKIRPPTFVPSTPKSLYSYKLWRAHEYLAFFLFYALPVFKDIMPLEYFKNMTKLIIFIENLLAREINSFSEVKTIVFTHI